MSKKWYNEIVLFCCKMHQLKEEDRNSLDEELQIIGGKLFDYERKLCEAMMLMRKEEIMLSHCDYCFATRDAPCNMTPGI